MSSRTVIVVFLALLCGVSAAVGVVQLWKRSGQADTDNLLPVVTVAGDVGRGQVLDAKLLKISRYRRQDVPKGAICSVDEAVGRTAVFPLVTSEPIVAGKLAEKGAGHGLAAMIPEGMRAFTIQTPHLAADVGGFLMPGNHVDVLLTTTLSGRDDPTGGGVTTTLLQNVQVLAVAQKMEAPEDSKPIPNEIKIVTLLVTPDQAAKLDLGMNKGILHLALRNPGDHGEAKTNPATMNDLRFHQEKPVNLLSLLSLLTARPVPSPVRVAEPKELSPVAAAKPKDPPVETARYTVIRTLRGMDEGTVRITTWR